LLLKKLLYPLEIEEKIKEFERSNKPMQLEKSTSVQDGGEGTSKLTRSISNPVTRIERNKITPTPPAAPTPAPTTVSDDDADSYDDITELSEDDSAELSEFSEVLNSNAVEDYLNIVNYNGKINIVVKEEVKLKFEIKTYTLSKDGSSFPLFYYTIKTDDNEITKYRIKVEQYKSLIENIAIYEFFGELPKMFDNTYIDINKELFEILFKDVFSDIKVTTTDPEELAKIWTPNNLNQRLMQLYINDVTNMYYLQLEINKTQTTTIITGFNKLNESKIQAIFFGYLLVVFNSTNVTPKILSEYSLLLLYDNYLLSVPQQAGTDVVFSFLGKNVDSRGLEYNTTIQKITDMPKYEDFFNKLKEIQSEIDATKTRETNVSATASLNPIKSKNKKQPITSKRIALGFLAGLAILTASQFSKFSVTPQTSLPDTSNSIVSGLGSGSGSGSGSDVYGSSLHGIPYGPMNAPPGGNWTDQGFSYLNGTSFPPPTDANGTTYQRWSNGGGKPRSRKNVKQHTKVSSSLKNKKHSKSKGNSLKNKKQNLKKRTHTMRKRPVYIGGAPDAQLDKFTKWCNDNKEKVSLSAMASGELGPIAKKKIFVKTTFNRSQLKLQRRKGAIVTIFGGIMATGSFLKNWTIGWFKSESDAKKESELKKDEFNKILQKLKETNALLSICFNNVEGIGVLNSKSSPNKITDDKELMDTSNSINLDWKNLQNTNLWASFRNLAETMFGVGKGEDGKDATDNLIGASITCISLYFAGAGFGAGIGVIIICNIFNAYNYWKQNPENKENIIKSALMQVLFNALTEIRYCECNKFQGVNAFTVFLEELDAQCKQIYSVFSDKNTTRLLPSGSETKSATSEEGKSSVELKIYKNKNVIGKDIKNKLVNLNIPMQSFYYAMNVVKTTYNLETGPLLVQYYENRELFLENYKKKEAKKK
jgi:hypothetical protein